MVNLRVFLGKPQPSRDTHMKFQITTFIQKGLMVGFDLEGRRSYELYGPTQFLVG